MTTAHGSTLAELTDLTAAHIDKTATGSADRAWTKRRNDLQRLWNVGEVVSDVDRQIAELLQRVSHLLDAENGCVVFGQPLFRSRAAWQLLVH